MEHLKTWLKSAVGRNNELAVHLGITPGAVSQWEVIPANRVVEISRFTQIPRRDLRPDLYD